MELSERAQAFMASLDPDALQVGDGADGGPVWVGIDAEAGRVYKVYASGLATGFGDGRLDTINGLRGGLRGMQSTRGEHIFAEFGDISSPDWHGVGYTAHPGPIFKSEAPNAQAHPSGGIIYKWTGPGGLKVTTGIQGDEAHDSVSVADDLCLCFGPRKLTPAEVCLVRRSAAPDAPAYDSIYGRPAPPFVIGGGSGNPDVQAR